MKTSNLTVLEAGFRIKNDTKTNSEKPKAEYSFNTIEIFPRIEENGGVVTVYSNSSATTVNLPVNMRGIKILQEYVDYQCRYYLKTNDDPFDSTKSYVRYLGLSMKYLGVKNILQFSYTWNIETLQKHFEVLKINLKERCDNDEKLESNILCAFKSLLNFLRFRIGTHDMHGNVRQNAVKVQFLSGLKYYKAA